MARRKRLGEILIDAGLINETQLGAALNSQKTWGGKLGSTLVRMGFVREEDILKGLSSQLRLPSVDFRKVKVSPRAIEAVALRIAEKYNVIPVALKEEGTKKTIILAMSDPTNLEAIGEIEFQTGVRVRPVVATESSVTRAIDQYYRKRKVKEDYGFEKKVDLASVPDEAEMVIFSRGEEKQVEGEGDDRAVRMVRALVRVLERKGVLDRPDVNEILEK